MFKLNRNEFSTILPMLTDIHSKAVFAYSVLEQTQQGMVFVNSRIHPTAALLTSCGGFYCLLGTASDQSFNDEAASFLNHPDNHIGFYALPMFTEEWEAALQRYSLAHATKIKRAYFRFDEERFIANMKNMPLELDEGLRLEALNEQIANQYREDFYTYYKLVWDSSQHFNEQGMGHFIRKDNKIISVCSSPYVGGGFAEIDIMTVEEHKRKGLAAYAGMAFIQDCLSRGRMPNWSCHSDNQASLDLANKLGFEQIAEHAMYWYSV